MSIEFHCSHCSKLIRAPRERGGKQGKCPHCRQSVYVPPSPEELEEIPLAPLDVQDEQHRQELTAESLVIESKLSHEDREAPPAKSVGSAGAETAMPPPKAEVVVDVPALVIRYVRAMQESNLDQADRICAQLKPVSDQARKHVGLLMMDEIPPPSLEYVPAGLLQGFLRTLLGRL